MGMCLHQLALQSNPDQPLQWLLPQMVQYFDLFAHLLVFLYHIYLISLSSNGLIDVDLCHTYMMISYCLFAMLVVSHYLQVVCRNHNPSFLSVLVVF